uniref:Uncharacterized protein n=1 Tax=Peronospora matthiolae TaxID=2874970 RepID=A0AAV1T680_9STRA
MRCAPEDAKNAAARTRAPKESTSKSSAECCRSTSVLIEQQAVLVANSPCDASPRATIISVASTAGAATRSVGDPGVELIYPGKSDDAYDSKAATPAYGSLGANTARARLTCSGKHGAIMSEIFRLRDSSEESLYHASPSDTRTRGDGGDA